MTERRFTESEIQEIFEAATRNPRRALPSGEAGGDSPGGLTLAELQEIAGEVGISPEAVARGAAALEAQRGADVQVRRTGGVPLGVSRTVPLARSMTREEWERLVSRLRQTFDATGTVTHQEGLMEWRNGNLRVALEPDGDGARLRLQTRRAGWEALPVAAGLGMGMSVVVLMAGVMGGDLADKLPGAAALLAMGGGAWSYGYVALRRWARTRLAQFGLVAEEVAAAVSETPLPPGE